MRRILIATEGSECSSDAIRRFIGLLGGEIELVVLSVIPLANEPDDHPAAAVHYQRQAELAQEALDQALTELSRAGYKAFGEVRVGEPAGVILDAAQLGHTDLIVMGTHGRKGLARLLKGSVAETVLHEAPCGVLIYPFEPQRRAIA
ncbi:MAG TPA: universal stress protein [Oscillatoriaceae cyanobacterium]